jgi:hypothetical protein
MRDVEPGDVEVDGELLSQTERKSAEVTQVLNHGDRSASCRPSTGTRDGSSSLSPESALRVTRP